MNDMNYDGRSGDEGTTSPTDEIGSLAWNRKATLDLLTAMPFAVPGVFGALTRIQRICLYDAIRESLELALKDDDLKAA